MERCVYPSDLSDAEFACLEPDLPERKRCGRPWLHPRRAILDAVFYLVRTGCQWRALPREYPPWSTVHDWFRRWRLDGLWERLNGALRERLRVGVGRDPQPSAAIVDSQSVKTTGVGGVRGYDGAKKLSGRKRHLLVDTLGWGPHGHGAPRRPAGPRRRASAPGRCGRAVPPPGARLGRPGLHRRRQGVDRGAPGLERGSRAAPAEAARGVGPARHGGRPAALRVAPPAPRAGRLPRRASPEVGRGADVRVDRAEPPDEQGVRAAAGDERGADLRDHEPPDGAPAGPRLTFQHGF